jgi:hypothetical protein
MLLHVIEHDGAGDKALAAKRTSVGSFPRMVSPMNREGRGLGEGLAAHGA